MCEVVVMLTQAGWLNVLWDLLKGMQYTLAGVLLISETMPSWTGAALALWRNRAAVAALRGWSEAAQWQRHARTTLQRCMARLRARVGILAHPSKTMHSAAAPKHVEHHASD
jgi:hypothetical protein